MRQRLLWTALATLTLLPAAASAQSVSAADGLGSPIEALDARARALGGVGIGLFGNRLVPTDPAAVADLPIPALTFSMHTSWVDVTEGTTDGSFTGTRFPMIGIAYPLPNLGVASLSFGTNVDQEFSVSRTSDIDLGGSGSTARVTDRFSSEGGLATLRLGFARRLGPSLAVGATVGTYTGDVSRVFTRTFDSIQADAPVPDFNVGGQWRYGGMSWSVGAAFDVGEVARMSASYSDGGTLDAKPTGDTDGGAEAFPMPSELRVGGTALLAPELALTAGLVRADWSDTGALYDGVDGFATTTWGSGVEFTGANILGKPGAVRLGYRSGGLPFAPTGSDDPSERIFSGGIGLDLLQNGDLVVASSDFTLERGSRTIGAVSEDFWRFVLTARVSGF